MSRRLRGAWLLLTMLLAVLTATLGTPARADSPPDWDGDGAVADDCRPLDPGAHPGAPDEPDLAGEDRNCDGVDGLRTGAYYVQPSGSSDLNVGTIGAPFQTVQRAINEARNTTVKSIYVATGTYPERLDLPANADGIRIYGGYSASSWDRSGAGATVVSGNPEAAVLDGARDVLFQRVTLSGSLPAGADPGSSAYGVRAIHGSEFALVKSVAAAGAGTAGSAGGPGSQPSKAADGAPGGGPPNCTTPGSGGSGAQSGAGYDGGAGGTGGQETKDGENGQDGGDGGGPSGGPHGAGGVDQNGDPNPPDWALMAGDTGTAGGRGSTGTTGLGGGNDFGLAADAWAGRSGGLGGTGGVGSGGGGGGGGAGRGAIDHWQAGAGGGQGGEGGLGGTGGGGGTAGGGSFAVYLNGSEAAIVDGSSAQSGAGGSGGAGGAGGTGGLGGDGGLGSGVRSDCAKTSGDGGAGGAGGQGGDGGQGGGGAGGPSASIMRLAGATSTDRASTLSAGSGGSGGSGTGTDGQSGQRLGTAGAGATDFDGDGIADSADACVEVPRGTDANGDGCPDRPAALPDGDGDGVPNDGRDKCPAAAATGTDADHDGCTDQVAATATATATPTSTSTSTSTSTTTPPLPPPPPARFNPLISHGFDFIRGWAVFYKLQVRDMPAGSKLLARCAGKGCRFKRKAIPVKSSKVNVLKALKPIRLRPGAVLTLTATSATGQKKVGTWRIAKHSKVTYRCAAAGGKLGSC